MYVLQIQIHIAMMLIKLTARINLIVLLTHEVYDWIDLLASSLSLEENYLIIYYVNMIKKIMKLNDRISNEEHIIHFKSFLFHSTQLMKYTINDIDTIVRIHTIVR